ncbi:bifunctional 4-hydroxy-2-oxoglutarate aldolase/2-dehydro-3-deoxy-phosphogluconate aldolase [Sphingorhabdus sp. Alg231-15]|uniref:bifunctional 4-hydroxy-2-oxoglutarate aldolase/2-dehydro-3-deoxy-phosphogluconate aldolase n=1 Tax=Sphingorhabdus sp. Alg231-15 TaxID=1922222 RepID=UPI000D561294
MRTAPVIPVLVIDDVASARPIAEALVSGGLPILEVTLRTDCALEAIAEMKQVEGAIVGAGTVLNGDHLRSAIDAGSEFIVSPGLTEGLVDAALTRDIPLLPGISSASDIMRGIEMGLGHFKFFPAEASGGLAALKAIAAPFKDCKFCPTGGVNPQTAPDWLALEAVLCVGGSWVVPKGVTDFEQVRQLAQTAAAF